MTLASSTKSIKRIILCKSLKNHQSIQRLSPLILSTSSCPISKWNPEVSRSFCSRTYSNLDKQTPAAIDYSSLLQPDEYQRLANSTFHDLQDRLEEYGDSVDIDGFDVDYANEVLTLKLGTLGTYVINKQTPNRQIWMSSPVSGPSRYDWDRTAQAWIYRRTKSNLHHVLQKESCNNCVDSQSVFAEVLPSAWMYNRQYWASKEHFSQKAPSTPKIYGNSIVCRT